MTGFQPHPGSGVDARGREAPAVRIEDICRAIGITVKVGDPFEVQTAIEDVYDLLQEEGPKVMVFRRRCFLVESREKGRKTARVIHEKCVADACGCDRFCSRVFNCPAILVDRKTARTEIDEAVCTGCGVCATICPRDAIVLDTVGA